MTFDVDSEELLTLHNACGAFPGGKRLSLATLHRWRVTGVRGVRLETLLIGGSRYTSREAISRFIAAQNAAVEYKQWTCQTNLDSNRSFKRTAAHRSQD